MSSMMCGMLLGAGVGISKTYVDDVFSTYLYTGNGSNRSIVNGIDNSQGGMIWTKARTAGYSHILVDTERGTNKYLSSNTNAGETTDAVFTSFNNNGYGLSGSADVNRHSNYPFAGWNFRKAPGFFDVVTWTGNGTAGRQISHDLKSKPGLILIKRTDGAAKWIVYHRDTGASKSANLNNTNAFETDVYSFNQTEPTSTHFSVGSLYTNVNNEDYVAYIFAGGEDQTTATARSVDFDGSGDALTTSTSGDYTFGTGDFTVEHWINTGSTAGATSVIDARTGYTNNWTTYLNTDFTYIFYAVGGNRIVSTPLAQGTWNHVALCRSSGTTTLYLNGIAQGTYSDSNNYTNTTLKLGLNFANGHAFIGKISNFRVVKGTAVYTSSFKPPTEPLTNITNTKLLCCNNSSVTGTTTGTVTSSGNPTASTDSPFDDPAAFTFGDSGDQNVIKTGSYVGNGSTDGPEINLGFEPQWILLKRTSGTGSWALFDCMRGIVTEGDDPVLQPDVSDSEYTTTQYLDLTSTGFKLKGSFNQSNADGDTYIFTCIRRSDGYVGKPPELGTGVFSLATGTNNTIPGFVSGFPVDFSLRRPYASSSSWYAASRLTGTNYLVTDGTSPEASNSNQTFDYQNGIGKWGGDLTSWMSWQWKRHAGFDVVCWEGTNGNVFRRHNLGKIPEMIIFKNRDAARSWRTYHKGLNGGTNPEDYEVALNGSSAEGSNTSYMNGTAPTSTHFVSGNDGDTNGAGDSYIALLFASANDINGNPISKVGSYTGNGSTTGPVITTGFAPRFVIIKGASISGSWFVYDTTRGFASGNDQRISLDNASGQTGTADDVDPSSTGFQIKTTWDQFNENGDTYLYYAHA